MMSLRRGTKLHHISNLAGIHFKGCSYQMSQCSYILCHIFIILTDFLSKLGHFHHNFIICFLKIFHTWEINIFRIIISMNSSYSLS